MEVLFLKTIEVKMFEKGEKRHFGSHLLNSKDTLLSRSYSFSCELLSIIMDTEYLPGKF